MLETMQNKKKREKCYDSELYAKISEKMYAIDKSPHAAHVLAQYFFKKNKSEKSEKYYKEAIDLQKDSTKKADLYFELALLYFNQMDQYSTARNYARKCLDFDPKYGKAYKLIGQIYAASAENCGESLFEHQAVYWAVVDKLIQARAVSPELADEVNPLISRYTANFPSQEDYFFNGYQKGQKYNIECWINETTTVR